MSIRLLGFILVSAGIILTLILWGYDRFINPQMSINPTSYERERFPSVKGSNLAGEEFVLPEEIEAEYAIFMIAFQQYHQIDVNTWIPVVRELSQGNEKLAYYELPTISRLNPAARSFIDGGMRSGIPDPEARATTITLYLDKASFRKVLNIPNEEAIVILLVDREGEIYWRSTGPTSPTSIEDLRATISGLMEERTDSP
jgi:hypothetical protein